MSNPIVLISNPATAVSDIENILAAKDKAIFMVLGNTPAHHALAAAALPNALLWRYVVHITVPNAVINYLQTLPINASPPVPSITSWFAICIQMDNTIIEVNTDNNSGNILPCFMMATP